MSLVLPSKLRWNAESASMSHRSALKWRCCREGQKDNPPRYLKFSGPMPPSGSTTSWSLDSMGARCCRYHTAILKSVLFV